MSDPATSPLIMMGTGLAVAVVGSFVAARLMRVDRLWAALGGPELAAQARAARADLLNLAAGRPPLGKIHHPLIAAGAPLLQQGSTPDQLRQQLGAILARGARPWRLIRTVGSSLSLACPIAGLGLLVAGLFSALGTLQSAAAPTADGAAPSISGASALSLMALVIAVPLVNTVSRRLPRRNGKPLAQRELLAQAVLDCLLLISEHRSHPELSPRLAEHFDELLGPALDDDAGAPESRPTRADRAADTPPAKAA